MLNGVAADPPTARPGPPAAREHRDLRWVLALTAFSTPLGAASVMAPVLLAVVVLDLVRLRRPRIALGPLTRPVLAFLAAIVLSTLTSEVRSVAIPSAVLAIGGTILFTGSTLWLLNVRPTTARMLARAFGLGAGVASLAGFWYAFSQQAPRAFLPHIEANRLGFGLMVGSLLGVAGWAGRPRTLVLLLLLSGLGLTATLSRAAAAGWTAGLLVLALTTPRLRGPIAGTIAILVALVLSVAPTPPFRTRIEQFVRQSEPGTVGLWRSMLRFTLSAEGNRDRLIIWSLATAVFLDHPLVGVGPGAYPKVVHRYQDPTTVPITGADPLPHNIFLSVAAELGLTGLVSFLWLLATGLRHGWASRSVDPDVRLSAVAAMVAMLVNDLREHILTFFYMAVALWLVLALLGYRKLPEPPHSAST